MKSNVETVGSAMILGSLGLIFFVLTLANPNEVAPLAVTSGAFALIGLVFLMLGKSAK